MKSDRPIDQEDTRWTRIWLTFLLILLVLPGFAYASSNSGDDNSGDDDSGVTADEGEQDGYLMASNSSDFGLASRRPIFVEYRPAAADHLCEAQQ